MSDFRPITTQEEFDAAIGERLKRERKAISEQYGDYEDLKTKNANYEKQIGELTKSRDALQAAVKGHETNSVKMRIAHETGIPFEMASRLSGETEDDIRKDAENMARFMSTTKQAAPLRSTEPAGVDPNKAALQKMLHDMKGE